MALPGDLTTFTLTLGPYTDAAGVVKLVGATAKLFPVDPATGKRLHLVHVATGQEIIPADIVITIGAGGTATVGPLPHTDNAGLSTVGFAYRVEWQVASGRRRAAPDDKTFAVPTAAGASVDYDLLDVADAVPGVLVPMGVSLGVADAAVAALIPTTSLTQAALDGRYLNEGSGAGGALSGSYPNPGLNASSVDTVVASKVADAASATGVALRAASVAAVTEAIAEGEIEVGSTQRKLLVVASNCWAGGGASGVQAQPQTSDKLHTIGVDCSDIRFVYANFLASTSADADGPSGYPIKAGIRIGASTIYRAPMRGQATVTVDPGGVVVTDPLAVELAAQTDIYSRTYINHTAWRPNTASFGGSGGGTNSVDLTDPGSAAIADGTKWMFAPSAVVGIPRDPDARAFGVIGDSIAAGISDFNAFGGNKTDGTLGGWVSRTLWRRAGWINVSVPSDTGAAFLASHYRRMALFNYVTDVICAYGINDLYNSAHSLATLQANWIATWRLMARRGLRAWVPTLTPRTTDTAGLTPYTDGKETNRVAANNWLRDGAPLNPTTFAAMTAGALGSIVAGDTGHPLTGIIEIADAVETARNSGIWKTGHTADGVHPYGGTTGTNGGTSAIAAVAVNTPGLFG